MNLLLEKRVNELSHKILQSDDKTLKKIWSNYKNYLKKEAKKKA
jgi:hypothetical protein